MARRFNYPLFIQQGKTLEQPFRRRYKGGSNDGQVIDFLDHDVTKGALEIRDKSVPEGGDVLVRLTTDNGGIVLGKYTDPLGKEWSGYITMLASNTVGTGALTPWGDAVWELVLWTPSRSWVKRIFGGTAYLIPKVTETE